MYRKPFIGYLFDQTIRPPKDPDIAVRKIRADQWDELMGEIGEIARIYTVRRRNLT
jgi:hypothetical protein